jgi:3',5'-nucleoside bisphosphate phosphatase
MRIDLHTHSDVSDGTTSPTEVMVRAADAGLDVVALTDHDSAAGWPEAAAAARRVGIGLVPGIELSTRHAGRGVHVLAYLVDPQFPPLAAELQQIVAGRDGRLAAMLVALEASGVALTEQEVRRHAGVHGIVGRPHVADALVERGLARDRADAFETLLNPGRAGFVVRYAPATVDAVALVTRAGGVCVLAHPWGRGSRFVLDEEALAALKAAGLTGIEVDHEDHPPADRTRLRAIANELGLVATGSSDYHGLGKSGHELGCNLTSAASYERLLDAAAANARAYGGPVPEVVRPLPAAG